MATTIQLVENLTVGKFVEVDGMRCEVEAVSFSQSITESAAQEELLDVMKAELLKRNIIDCDQSGIYFWVESGENLIPDQDYGDDI
ncbi:hypothetical protein [Photobacterium damselae]|uniref:hypothetical protein n=1 Tax=Photobacterium damselae TaxID=38293 RepID=UPI001F2DBC7F|nr:hypothetical protein [Photobacterium damselae]UKA04441.1 hypothetical protein IHC89_22730 [Photobacterium damselae subsp. damselae]